MDSSGSPLFSVVTIYIVQIIQQNDSVLYCVSVLSNLTVDMEVLIYSLRRTLLGPSDQEGWIQLGIVVACEWER